MSQFSYFINDGYFNEIIDSYFDQKDNWTKQKKSEKITFFNSLIETCQTCHIVSNFTDTSALGNKKKLYVNLMNWSGGRTLSYLPKTYSFESTDSLKKYELSSFWKNKQWILKPEFGMRQEGVGRVRNYREFSNWLKKYPNEKKWIIQRYIHKPLLFKGKKMHFRVYAFMIRYGNTFEAYLYPSGYMYVADYKYDSKVFKSTTHITTSCNNKTFPEDYNMEFGANTFKKDILPQFKRICHDSMMATYTTMKCPNTKVPDGKYICWKMLGYDIIADHNKKCYLLEANSRIIGMAESDPPGNCLSKNPSLQTKEFKTGLMYNMINIALSKMEKKQKLIQNVDGSNIMIKLFSRKVL
jgi:hypothetical protein